MIKNRKVYTILIAISLLMIVGCNSRKNSEKRRDPFMLPPSFVSFNIDFPIQELESGVNGILKKVLIDDEIPLNDKGDLLYLTVIKTGKLDLALRENHVFASLPLDVKVAVKKKVMGITFSNKDTPIAFTGTIQTKASATLDSAWNFQLSCREMNLLWDSEPSLNILGLDFDLSKTLKKALDQHEDKILDELCNAVNNSIDFRSTLEKIWRDIQKPIRIARNPEYLWLYTVPEALNAELLPLKKDTLSIHVEYKADIHVTTDQKRATHFQKLPSMGKPLNNQSTILAYVETALPIALIQEIVAAKLTGETYAYQDYSATIEQIQVKSEGQNLAAEIHLIGGITGILTVSGKPKLDDNFKLTIVDFKYEIESEDNLALATDWISHSMIEGYVANQVFVDASSFFSNLDSLANAGIAKSKLRDKMSTHLDFREISSYHQHIVNDTLKWVFYVEGSGGLSLKQNIFSKKESPKQNP